MKIYVVGIGPGNLNMLTQQAKTALEKSDAIVGYDVYIDLIKDLCNGKKIIKNGMKQEVDRCNQAIKLALENMIVSVVSSGDATVYGMAGLIFELSKQYPQIDIEIVPGITAALSASALLGAPLGHDFSIISLSDLLTPWDIIEKRIYHSGLADFVICLYNPKSKKRTWQIEKVAKILLEIKPKNIQCGMVKNIGRVGEEKHVFLLEQLANQSIDMFTTIIIGNSQTKMINEKIVTPRGYCLEESV